MSYKTRRELRREIELKDRMLAHYADMADYVPALASDRERLIRENGSLSKRVMLLEKAIKGFSRLKLELGATVSELSAENTKLKAENEYLSKVVDAAAESKEFIRTVFESEAV